MTQHAERAVPYTFGSLFTGIGGIDLAFEREGFDIAFQVEIDDYCNKVLAKHWPNVKRYGDIRTVTDLPAVDVLAGGFPCQDISNAGKRAGIKEGNRSGLWIEFARLIGEIRPRFVLLENVAAITSRDGSRVVADLAALGYGCEWGIVAASNVGAPHRRERWWCVAYAKSSGDRRERFRQAETQGYSQEQNDGSKPHGSDSVMEHANNTFTTRANDPIPTRRNAPHYAGIAMVNANGERQQEQRGDFAAKSPFIGVECTDSGMGYSESSGLQRFSVPSVGAPSELAARRERQTKSILGRAVDGLSRQLDLHRWPARPGQEQFPWEAPRTVSGLPNRASRLKALGNSVVPQVVQPFAAAIHSVLTEQDSRHGAE